MKCERARRYVLPFLDDELGHEPAQDLERHLAGCPACRRRVEGERALEARFRSSLGALDARHREAWERARDTALGVAKAPPPPGTKLVGVLAGVLLALAVFVIWMGTRPEATAPLARVAQPSSSASADGDGSEVAIPWSSEPSLETTTMKPITLLGAATAVSVVSAASTSLLLASGSTPPEPGPTSTAEGIDPQEGQRLDEQLEDLARRQVALEGSIAELRRLLETGRASSREPLVSQSEIERLVLQVLERREAPAPVAKDGAPDLALAAILRELSDPALDEAGKEAIWARVRASGQIDALVAAFERRAQANPYDSVAQSELGTAYLQKMLTTRGGPEAGRWGSQGGAALEHALELDETNWDARFTLARHYFYADMHGDSIRQFEVLVDQQEQGAPKPAFAQTYLWLGNLYINQGERVEAIRTWSDGLRLFPSDEALRARLKAFE